MFSSVSYALQTLKRKFSSAESQPDTCTKPSEKESSSNSLSSEPMNRPEKRCNITANNSFATLEETEAKSSNANEDAPNSDSPSALSKSTRRKERRELKKKEVEDAIAAAAAEAARDAARPPPRLILLVGLPGSGKSTLAAAILAVGGSSWTRVSQDDLGSRQLCEQRVSELLDQRMNVIVDRCNHDPRQRGVWIHMAQRARAAPPEVVHLDVPLDECLRRVMRRPSHPTLNSSSQNPQALAAVVYSFSKNFVRPSTSEGIGKLYVFNASHSAEHIVSQLQLGAQQG